MPSINIPRNLDQFKTELRNRILARQVRLGKLPASYFELNPYYNGVNALQTYWNNTSADLASNEFYGDVMVRGGEEVWLNLNGRAEREEFDGQFLDANLFGTTSFEAYQPIAYAFGDGPYDTPLFLILIAHFSGLMVINKKLLFLKKNCKSRYKATSLNNSLIILIFPVVQDIQNRALL